MTDLPLVPVPLSVESTGTDPFVLAPGTTFVTGPSSQEISAGVLAAELLGPVVDFPLGLLADDATGGTADHVPLPDTVDVRLDPHAGPADADPTERYSLLVHPDGVLIRAPRPAGLLRGIATLRQLATRQDDGTVHVPPVRIEDAPRYGWRGLSLDVVRHFFTVGQVCSVLCAMAQLKLNVLHLHLTDDQGWRIDVPSRPRLTQLSSGTAVGGGVGGFYSAQDYADIVAHAAARHITVVPEIDVPGHINAALHALPELTPDGVAPAAYTGMEVGFSRLRRDVPATRPFLEDVFGDLAAMTPGPHLHVGGDEVQEMGADEYAWFVRTAQDVVRRAGKSVVGWQEIAHGEVDPGTVVQYWDPREDPAPFVAAARRGARLLLSPASRVYLDMKYDAATRLGLHWAGHVELSDAFDWEPDDVVAGVPPDAVVGGVAAGWTETLSTPEDLFTMLLPRLAAVAEVAWSDRDRRDWEGFRRRVAGLAPGWDRDGFAWYRSPQVDW